MRKGQHTKRWRLRPLCLCGCGVPVKKPQHRYASVQCVPSTARSLGGVEGRRAYAFKMRTRRYRTEIARVLGSSRSLSREQLLELCEEIYRRGFQSGYAARCSRERREARQAA